MGEGRLHPVVKAASKGTLPGWARMSRKRREHAARVARLLEEWARRGGLPKAERRRWTAAGWLHDALKGEKISRLRKLVPAELRDLPKPVLHGPAVAERLRQEDVDDESLLLAVAWHSLGHPGLDVLGRVLYAADFLEPGRNLRNEWRAGLRERMPDDEREVVREILKNRIEHLLRRDRAVRPETMAFWNSLTEGESWVRASAG